MTSSFEELLNRKALIKDASVLSPHYVPDMLLHREEQIKAIMEEMVPALKGQKPKNVFIYGKTGTGKTTSVKYVMQRFNEAKEKVGAKSTMVYMNCRIYNSRYRILQRFLKEYFDEIEKSGFGISYFYERMIEKLSEGEQIVLVLDEIDVVKDIDDLIYTLVRANDEVRKGGLTVVGISNKLGFKADLDPRSRSSLYEREIIFPPYDAKQLKEILQQRVKLGFKHGTVSGSAVALIAAITAQENGDARYALKLLQTAGEIAEAEGSDKVEESHVESARRRVEYDIAAEAMKTLPLNHQLLLYALAKMTLNGKGLGEDEDKYFFSGELYDFYTKVCKKLRKPVKSARSYRDYLNDLESLGFLSTVFTSKGIRGHTRLIKIGHNPEDIIRIVERNLELNG